MALNDTISFGIALPHRSPDPIDVAAVRHVAERADALGFRDLWVTENTLDHAFCFDSMLALTYAAAITTRIRLGVSVIVLPMQHPIHVAHQIATLDYLSNGRAIFGAGLGKEAHYAQFQVPLEHRVRRFRESVEVIKALWTESKVSYQGNIFQLDAPECRNRCKPHRRSGRRQAPDAPSGRDIADAWMGSARVWRTCRDVPILKAELERAWRTRLHPDLETGVFLARCSETPAGYTGSIPSTQA
jgi:alkanesulfonate monooxygenase SsuD/methylene tetrahydromethanopterin reductase-like flavin-dependent oxidoreductase (luciferase family)